MISLEKYAKKVDLVKEEVGFPKNQPVDVVVEGDHSGSMREEQQSGNFQHTAERFGGIGYSVDRNKAVEFYGFNHSARYVGTLDETNYSTFVKDVFIPKCPASGTTKYAPAMQIVLDSLESKPKKGLLSSIFHKKESTQEVVPKFVIFITDGKNDTDDWKAAEKVVRESSNKPVFWMFVGIGSDNEEDFPFLQQLDDMEGRVVDNADFFCVEDITKLSDEVLYRKLLTEFPSWLKEAKTKGIL